MFDEFYGLREDPFSSQDGKFFYLSRQHHQSLIHLVKRLRMGSPFLLLTGEEGTGKTALARQFSAILSRHLNLSVVDRPPGGGPRELLGAICDGYGIPHDQEASEASLFNKLRGYFSILHRCGEYPAVIIDDAHLLSDDCLELLRHLVSKVVNRRILAQIILVARTEILSRLGKVELRNVSRYILGHADIGPLSHADVIRYVVYRIRTAGGRRELFDPAALKLLSTLSGGNPGIINALAGRCIREGSRIGLRILTTTDVSHASLTARDPGTAPEFILEPAVKAGKSEAGKAVAEEEATFSFPFMKVAAAAMVLTAGTGFGALISAMCGPVMPLPQVTPKTVIQTLDNTRDMERMLTIQEGYRKNIHKAVSVSRAMRQLFRVWGYSAAGISCKNAHYAKLECYNFTGTAKELIHLNHPALMSLYDSDEKLQFYGILTGVDKENSTLIIGNASYEVNNQWLEDMWDGEAVILWRTLPSGKAHLTGDSNATDFAYMSRALSLGTGSRNQHYESITPAMVRNIQAFQKKENLDPDGKLGAKTIMLLNARGGAVMPRLVPITRNSRS